MENGQHAVDPPLMIKGISLVGVPLCRSSMMMRYAGLLALLLLAACQAAALPAEQLPSTSSVPTCFTCVGAYCSRRTVGTCVFPFKYKGTTYNACTTADWGSTPWCYTSKGSYPMNAGDTGKQYIKCACSQGTEKPKAAWEERDNLAQYRNKITYTGGTGGTCSSKQAKIIASVLNSYKKVMTKAGVLGDAWKNRNKKWWKLYFGKATTKKSDKDVAGILHDVATRLLKYGRKKARQASPHSALRLETCHSGL